MKKAFKIFIVPLAIIFFIFLVIFCYFFVGSSPIQKNILWGVDFSQMQAESLGLNWKEVYSAIIDDLELKNIKIHTQWDWVEGKNGEYFFEDVDWQLKKAEENNVKIIYVLGLKTGRWPECHMPVWAENLSEQEQKDAVLSFVRKVVERYKDNNSIVYWQVENEPFFNFGECPNWYYENDGFLKQEVNLVKSLDPSRKIIISDTGENSMWFKPAKIGDIVGTTMYREAWVHITETFGFSFRYLFSPVYYSRKAVIINKIFGKDVICIELQAEPWASKPFYDVPLDEQLKIMNLEKFKENIVFAKDSGLNQFYLWGAEWWYWMKVKQGQPEIWNEAKKLFIIN